MDYSNKNGKKSVENQAKSRQTGPLDIYKIGQTSGAAEKLIRSTVKLLVDGIIPISFFENETFFCTCNFEM